MKVFMKNILSALLLSLLTVSFAHAAIVEDCVDASVKLNNSKTTIHGVAAGGESANKIAWAVSSIGKFTGAKTELNIAKDRKSAEALVAQYKFNGPSLLITMQDKKELHRCEVGY